VERVWPYLQALRPRQWVKNSLLYLAFFFTVNERWDLSHPAEAWGLFLRVTWGALAFCALASATYLVNDLRDAPRDRVHPRKRRRPIASGAVPASHAWGMALLLGPLGLGASFLLSPAFGGVALAYLGLTLGYSFLFKRVVLVELFFLAGGYLLRAVAGAVALAVPISPWLYITTGLGALLIGLGKRRNELVLAGGEAQASAQRETLAEYSVRLLDQLIAVVTPAVLMAYILYTFTAPNLPANQAMMLTIPFVAYGLFRYLYLVYQRDLGEAPEEFLLRDRPLMATVVLWLALAFSLLVLYRGVE